MRIGNFSFVIMNAWAWRVTWGNGGVWGAELRRGQPANGGREHGAHSTM